MNTPILYPVLHIVAGAETHVCNELDRGKQLVSEMLAEAHDDFRENSLLARRIPTLHAIMYDSSEGQILSEGVRPVTRDTLRDIPSRYRPFIAVKENDLISAHPSDKPNKKLEEFLRTHVVRQVILTGTLPSVIDEMASLRNAKATFVLPLYLIGDTNGVGHFGEPLYLRWNKIQAERAMAHRGIHPKNVSTTLSQNLAFCPTGRLRVKPFDRAPG